MGETVIHLDVVHREVEQGIEGRETGAEVIQADLDPLGPEFVQRGEGVGTLPGEPAPAEFEDEPGMTLSSSMMPTSRMICSRLGQMLPERLREILKRPPPRPAARVSAAGRCA